MGIHIKRVYEAASSADGYRVLVDRIWPRGVSKQKASADVWLKDVAPSTELREWFHHESPKWEEFHSRYLAELAENPGVETLRGILREHKVVTLVYSARNEEQNQAVVLREFLSHG